MTNLDAYYAAKRALEDELGVALSLGYTGNLDHRTGDDRSWNVCLTSMPIDTARTGRGPWSHRASGYSYPATRSWTTDAFPTVDEFVAMIRDRVNVAVWAEADGHSRKVSGEVIA